MCHWLNLGNSTLVEGMWFLCCSSIFAVMFGAKLRLPSITEGYGKFLSGLKLATDDCFNLELDI